MEEEPQEEFFYCSGAATQLLKLGSVDCWPKDDSNTSSRVLFLIIPGNPGIVCYYKHFMQILHKILMQKYPVWAISHAGHCIPPEGMGMMEDVELEDVFGLNGQIAHKLAFLRKNVPKANAMYMGSQEMMQVVQRDNSTIKHFLNKLIFYYGSNDHWCPVTYYEDMKRCFPEGTILLCQKGIRHAFVLDANVEVAHMVTEWLKADLANL
ncbi:lipid droplet-associated hydrolase isoform X4 [Hypanus sabinus]|uniref:lipid droplet-associated hydrolase isoform X4 n=1 Tax=Hypanus sabinus TaxID=79690 RepID=UPI0028C3D5B3|nr:lipid droplet-associated hydrolase isoform X4 [Hypanus sabinus]